MVIDEAASNAGRQSVQHKQFRLRVQLSTSGAFTSTTTTFTADTVSARIFAGDMVSSV
jgi:hypothetical protein